VDHGAAVSGVCGGLPPLVASPLWLLKTVHLRRWRAYALVATYPEYVSLGASHTALHLDLFESSLRMNECRHLIEISRR